MLISTINLEVYLTSLLASDRTFDLADEEIQRRFELIKFLAIASETVACFTISEALMSRTHYFNEYCEDTESEINMSRVLIKLTTFINKHEFKNVLTFDFDALDNEKTYISGQCCDLLFNNKLDMHDFGKLSSEQMSKLSCNGAYELILEDTLSIELIFSLTLNQCCHLDDTDIKENIIKHGLIPENIPDAEIIYQLFMSDTDLQTVSVAGTGMFHNSNSLSSLPNIFDKKDEEEQERLVKRTI